MCWRTPSNVACSFCPTPCPLPNGVYAVGEGEKK